MYPELTLDMKPFLFQQYVSFVIELITHRFFNTRNKLEAYIPTLFNPITQQARRLHAADLWFLPSDSLTFPPKIIYIEVNPQTK